MTVAAWQDLSGPTTIGPRAINTAGHLGIATTISEAFAHSFARICACASKSHVFAHLHSGFFSGQVWDLAKANCFEDFEESERRLFSEMDSPNWAGILNFGLRYYATSWATCELHQSHELRLGSNSQKHPCVPLDDHLSHHIPWL